MGIRALILTVCVGGFALWMIGPAKEPGVDPIVSASVKSGDLDYTVSNIETGAACLVTRGARLGGHSRSVEPGSDCEAVWPGLAEARNWTQNEDQTVTLTDASGTAILTLGLGDGVDFEALEPTNAVLAFNAVQFGSDNKVQPQ